MDSGLLDYGIRDRFVTNVPNNDKLLDEKYLVFIHGASRDNKCWPEKNWVELANLVKTVGLKVKLPWGNQAELDRANSIAQSASNVEVLPKTTLTDVGTALFHAKGVIAVDTGFGHLAAAFSIPTISLYGPTDPKSGGAYGKNQIHLTNMRAVSAAMVWEKIKAVIPACF